MTEYHRAPYTLDPTQELPDADEVPRSAGHNEDQEERVRELHEENKQAYEEAAQQAAQRAEQGVEEPPYPAGHDAGEEPEEQPEAQADAGGASDGPPNGTVQEVLDWVGDDPARAQQALDAERQGQNRSTLIAELEARV